MVNAVTVKFAVAVVIYLIGLIVGWTVAGGIDGNEVGFRIWVFLGIWFSAAVFSNTLFEELRKSNTDRYSTGFADYIGSIVGGMFLSIGLFLVTVIPLSFIF